MGSGLGPDQHCSSQRWLYWGYQAIQCILYSVRLTISFTSTLSVSFLLTDPLFWRGLIDRFASPNLLLDIGPPI